MDRSALALRGLNLSAAGMDTGLGAFLPVYLATNGWTHAQIGIAISLAIASALVVQIPGGLLLDYLPRKRIAAAVFIVLVAGTAIAMALMPSYYAVLGAQIVQGAADSLLAPTIAALTLSLAGRATLGERFGSNVRYAALGGMGAAAGMGLLGSFAAEWVLYASAALGVVALGMLMLMRRDDLRLPVVAPVIRPAVQRLAVPSAKRGGELGQSVWTLLRDRRFLVFVGAMAIYQLGSASLMPIATNEWSSQLGAHSNLLVAVAVMLHQGLSASISPWFGRLAERVGRRRILLIGFGVLPLRAVCFAATGNPYLEMLAQGLDGLSGAAFGVMVPLMVADITKQSGRFNLVMGCMGVLGAVGAAVGNLCGGWLADTCGSSLTFMMMAGAGVAAFAMIAILMPDTNGTKTQTTGSLGHGAANFGRGATIGAAPC